MKKTTYAILGLIASGFVIIFGMMLVACAISKPHPPYYYDKSAGVEVTVGEEVEEVEDDTVFDEPDLIP